MKKFLIILIVSLIIIPVSIHLWTGSLIKQGIQKYVPPIVGVPVSVDNISVSLFDGEFKVKNLVIENPPQFGNTPAFSIGKIETEIDLMSLFKNTLIIKKVEIERPTASLLIGEQGLNLDIINKNIQTYIKKSASQTVPEEKNVIIKKLKFEDGAVILGGFGTEKTILIPDFEERNIGERKKNSLSDTIAQIISKFSIQALKEQAKSNLSFGKVLIEDIKDDLNSRLQNLQNK
ncbi:MAG: AsmA family protein [Alphaproteobacteria bacterium]|nr:AsmA family protein [Alphaproteobacteria bacterium]